MEKTDAYFDNLCGIYQKYNKSNADTYKNPNVKWGLRNSDGTGVVAGITNICNVHGYLINEGERMPIDGELFFRGYSIKDIVQPYTEDSRYCFEEVAFLILTGKLPTQDELDAFVETIGQLRNLPEKFNEDIILRVPSRNIMNTLERAILGLYAYDEEGENNSIANNFRQGMELISRFPVIVSYAYQAMQYTYNKKSLYIHYPEPALSTAENILHIIRPNSAFTKQEAHLLDVLLVLHAEHGGGNNSTFATRVLTSAGTDMYSAIAAAVGSLKGAEARWCEYQGCGDDAGHSNGSFRLAR